MEKKYEYFVAYAYAAKGNRIHGNGNCIFFLDCGKLDTGEIDEMCEDISPVRLQGHLRTLADDIGVRLSGSKQEGQAADYIEEAFRQCGADVSREEFAIHERAVVQELLEIRRGDRWE